MRLARLVEPLLDGWRPACVVRPLPALSAGVWACALGLEALASSLVVYAGTRATVAAMATGIGSVLLAGAALTLVLAATAHSR